MGRVIGDMRVGQSRKRDANEGAIVDALRKVGAKVHRLSEPGCPDLLVWHPNHGVLLLEVKAPKTGKLTPLQITHQADGWPVCVVRNESEALALFGIVQ